MGRFYSDRWLQRRIFALLFIPLFTVVLASLSRFFAELAFCFFVFFAVNVRPLILFGFAS